MVNLVLVSLILAAVALIIGGTAACVHGARDGHIASRREIAEDIREDT